MKVLRTLIEALYRAQGDVDAEIEAVFNLTEHFFLENRYDLVDEFLMTVDVCRLEATTIECVLRSSYRFQHVLPNWKHYLDEAKSVLKSMGRDPGHLLAGLEP